MLHYIYLYKETTPTLKCTRIIIETDTFIVKEIIIYMIHAKYTNSCTLIVLRILSKYNKKVDNGILFHSRYGN